MQLEPTFSQLDQGDAWSRLPSREYDLIVIGGGITGAGIAWDAARRGWSVALFEAGDFAAGTSSRSSRLVHGGLRYLETGDIRLVFEASGERRRLLRNAPHLVHPLPFLFPIYRSGPVASYKLRAGLLAYDSLSLFRNIERHRMLRPREIGEIEPGLEREGLRSVGKYFDASVDDARLTLAVIRAAHEAGAAVFSHTPVVSSVRQDGSIAGVRARRDGEEIEVSGRAVVNATGPWLDRIRSLFDGEAAPRLHLTKGVHIMVPRERMDQKHAIIFHSPIDERVMFILPWGEFSYVGTTDTEYEGDPAAVAPEVADIDYLLASANALYPEAALARSDITSAWAGLRPLLAPERAEVDESGISREHEIWTDSGGLVSIGGGKLTTFRVMGKDVVDYLRDHHPSGPTLPGSRSDTDHALLPGASEDAPDETLERATEIAISAGLPEATASHLASRYGMRVSTIVGLIGETPELSDPIVPGRPEIHAQLVYGVRHEGARTLEDLLRRRLHLFYEMPDGGQDVAAAITDRISGLPELQWTPARRAEELATYQRATSARCPQWQ